MIDFLRGKAVYFDAEYMVLDVNGIGYRIFCAHPQQFADKRDKDIVVYTYHHVREDAILLYGFARREEQQLFRRLLEVSGIGPKVAIGIMSGARPEEIVAAIRSENISFLTRLPGVGKKTAQRLILDLKDKLKDAFSFDLGQGGSSALEETSASFAAGLGDAWSEAKQGLHALGFTDAESDRALASVKANADIEPTVDAIMRQALKLLHKG